MKIKKFENYNFNYNEDISTEYAKYILSKYMDDEIDNNISLEEVYVDTIKKDELNDQATIIKYELISYLENLLEKAKDIRSIYKIDANKYNL